MRLFFFSAPGKWFDLRIFHSHAFFYDILFTLPTPGKREFHETKNSFPKVLIFLCVVSCHVFQPAWQTGTFQVQPVHFVHWSIVEGEEGFPLREVIWSVFILFAQCYAMYFASRSLTVALFEGRTAWWSNRGWRWIIFVFFFFLQWPSPSLQLTDWWSPEGARRWTDWLTDGAGYLLFSPGNGQRGPPPQHVDSMLDSSQCKMQSCIPSDCIVLYLWIFLNLQVIDSPFL